jgi:hypothetical protein
MKKLTIALSVLFLFSITSCNKEDIKPNLNQYECNQIDDDRINTEQDNLEINILSEESIDDKPSNKNLKGSIIMISDSLNVITDPNRDEDEERKVKRK